MLMDLVQPNPYTPPTNVDYVYFTVPIMAYIMKGGKNINDALREGLKKEPKTSDFVWTGGGGPKIIPCVWTQFQNF